MEIRTVPRPTCLLCGSQGKPLYSDLKDRMFAVPGNWSLKQCTNNDCGLCWLNPTPLEADIPQLYRAYYTHGDEGGSGQNLLARLRVFFYSGYMAATYLPSNILGLRKAKQQISNMFLLDLQPGKLLDVGCGSGHFLHRMYKLGWSATGLDFDAKAIEYAKAQYGSQLTVLATDLAGAKFAGNSFNAVTMNHVIEHVPDPIELLREARRVLKTDGRLVVTTPNIRSFGHEKFRDCWRGLETPRHLQIFSLAALRECARKAGFTRIKVITSSANADIIIGGSFGFLEAKATGDCSSGSRVKINFIRGVRSLLLQYREAFRLRRDPECGEELILFCEK
jgi:SAM-dependent methyltransferase